MTGAAAGLIGYLDISDNAMIINMTMATGLITQADVNHAVEPLQDYESWSKIYSRLRQLDRLVCKRSKLGNCMLDVNRALRLIKRNRVKLIQARFEIWI